jgi:hypothetical protein
MSEVSIKVGEINESGFLQNLFRKGFSFAKSLSEIHANSVDAKATNITYVIDDGSSHFFRIIFAS